MDTHFNLLTDSHINLIMTCELFNRWQSNLFITKSVKDKSCEAVNSSIIIIHDFDKQNQSAVQLLTLSSMLWKESVSSYIVNMLKKVDWNINWNVNCVIYESERVLP